MKNKIKILLLTFFLIFSSDGFSKDYNAQKYIEVLCDKAGVTEIRDAVDVGTDKKYIKTGSYTLGIMSHNNTYYRGIDCYQRVPPGTVIEYIDKVDYRAFNNPISKKPDWSGLWYKVISSHGDVGWVLGDSEEDKRKYAVKVNINTIDHARKSKESTVKYSAQEVRNWYFFDEVGGNEFLNIYLSDAMNTFRATNTAEVLWRVNSMNQYDLPEQVLANIEKALKDFVKVVDLIALLGGKVTKQNDEYGELYTLFLINQARTKNQTASFRYEDLRKNGFKKASPTASAFHAIGLDPSRVEKWTNTDGREYVYLIDSEVNRKLIFDGINNGTFNYCSDFVCHMIMDVLPWVLWGATISDTTTPNERAIAFRDAFTALRYVKEAKENVEKLTSLDF